MLLMASSQGGKEMEMGKGIQDCQAAISLPPAKEITFPNHLQMVHNPFLQEGEVEGG